MKKFILVILLGLSFLSGSLSAVQVQAFDAQEYGEINLEQSASLDINEISNMTNVVIFIRFQDEAAYVAPHDLAFYDNLFNGVDVVSLRDYYLEVSYGQMEINSVFAVPNQEIIYYVDSHDRSYFEEYDSVTNPDGISEENSTLREHELLKRATDYVEANNLIDDSINLDVNDDGEIDSISYLISGEDQGWNSMLWPHKWSLSSFYDYSLGEFKSNAPSINGLYAYTYTFELLGNSAEYNYAVEVGVLAHETFHLISAPDLYHYYDYNWIDPIGYWGLMESINSVPNHMLGYMKEVYGNWIQDVNEINESGSYTLYPLQDSADNLYRINTGYSNEYVYLEYRDNVGLYESGLSSSGLLVYRVDIDYIDDGNVDGYYDSEGNPMDEVFIFRPGIVDILPPITFEDFDDDLIDEDGDIENAALSDTNLHDEMGNGTSITMFHSDGSLMDMKIYNVVEHDGYITFDVYMPPVIDLVTNISLSNVTNLYLVDLPGLNYYVDISNLPVDGTIYFTTDGTTPNMNSDAYQGNPILITADNNQITTALYIDDILMSTFSKSYQFASSIESEHYPYGNDVLTNWYIHFNQTTEYDLEFNSSFELESGYDFLNIFDGLTTSEYTGVELQNQTISYNNDGLLIQFDSDYSEDGFYGFLTTIAIQEAFLFDLVGDSVVTSEVHEAYIDFGYSLTGTSIDGYYVETLGVVDLNAVGDYFIQYDSFDILIETVTRSIHIVDSESPEITLLGVSIMYLEYNETYAEEGATFTDNYDITGEVVISGDVVLIDTLGTYIIRYNITDSFGNVANEVTRTIIIQDTITPEILLTGDLTVYVELGEAYTESGATFTDNYDASGDALVGGDTVDNLTLGTYTVTYNVTDSNSNIATQVTRTVIVEDTKKPVVSLNPSLDTIEAGSAYNDYGVTAIDSSATVVTVEGAVDINTPGVYILTYYVNDAADNTAIIRRYVTVTVKNAVVEFDLDSSQTTIQVDDSYVDGSCFVSVNGTNFSCTVKENNVDSSTAGIYTIIYSYTLGGKEYTYSRYIFVVADDTALQLQVFVKKEDGEIL